MTTEGTIRSYKIHIGFPKGINEEYRQQIISDIMRYAHITYPETILYIEAEFD
jgi:hypothetical protein